MHASPYRGQINPFFFCVLSSLLGLLPHTAGRCALSVTVGERGDLEREVPPAFRAWVCGVVSSCPVTACSSPLTPPQRVGGGPPRPGPRSSDVLHQLVARPGRLVVVYRVLRGPVHDHRPKQAAAAQLEEVYEVPETSVVEGTLYGR